MKYTIVEIKEKNFFHYNLTNFIEVTPIPEGWAYLPENIATNETENYPYAEIKIKRVFKENAPKDIDIRLFGENKFIDIVTSWTPKPIPEDKPSPPEYREEDDVNAMLVDHELRISMLELGGDI